MVQNPHNSNLFSFPVPDDYRSLRKILQDTGYTDADILAAIGVKGFPSIRAYDLPLLLHRTQRGTALDTLIRLFLVEVPCSVDNVRQAFHPIKLEVLEHAGLIRLSRDMVQAGVQLLPYQKFILAFDLPGTLKDDSARDFVMGIGRSTLTLANLTVRRPSRSSLDLGTGCGIQAFFAAEHSERVLAVDRNPRAVQLARFNARLNELEHVECLEGDLFEPVKEITFDLVVTNPPFVISPESRYTYRDGGMPGDRICQKIVRQVPQFLNEGGYCHILSNWVEHAGQEWHERLEQWFRGSGCDVWVMRTETADAATYASNWIRHTERREPEQFVRRFEEWLDYYRENNIDAVGAGLITMRRCTTRPNWFRADEGPEKILGPSGEFIACAFELRDFLESVKDDSMLLDACLHVSPDIRLEQQLEPSLEGWTTVTSRLHLNRGLPYAGNVDAYIAGMVSRCDGTRALRELLADMAASLKQSPEEIAAQLCMVVRGLIERGFLLPPEVYKKFTGGVSRAQQD